MDESVTKRVTVEEAARLLGIKEESVRKRVSRGKLRADKDADGRLLVYVDSPRTVRDAYADQSVTGRDELLASRDRIISILENQLSEEREARRRADTIIAQLTQATAEQARTIRELEEPQKSQSDGPGPRETSSASTQGGGASGIFAAPSQRTTAVVFWALLVFAVLGPTFAIVLQQFFSYFQGKSDRNLWAYALLAAFVLPPFFGYAFGRHNGHLTMLWRRRTGPPPDALFAASLIGGGVILALYTGVFLYIGLELSYEWAADLGGEVPRDYQGSAEELTDHLKQALGGAVITAMFFVFAALFGKSRQTWHTHPGSVPIAQALIGLIGTVVTAVVALLAALLGAGS